ncbi:ATP-dependent Clp protease proteolytic subunit [Bartonella sp. HY329]|uniref:ATP-dependent Clp protease proteolytic subunit n=1 Tax=unclassified Bartonella TaxID=2645622 RepID=UPI0021CAC0C7|nr:MULTISPECIES: ATP-dependent Clp protease proteolytic subunit [unclassified Bartonella]UXM96005.1 ATP-dependent Clp protease proteolytic subunit [Bartonella sp. HY329]UXN10330.1 ATP-dependent Clp protease proteolytic subunit [Bartonella sp. HY328]
MSDEKTKETKDENAAKPLAGRMEENLFRSRFVFIIGGIDDKMAKNVVAQLIGLAQESSDPIYVVVSSPGGHVESGDLIHDMVKFIPAPVTMIGSGWVASAGTHIFLAVPKERRLCLENTRFLIHEPSGGIGGSATDVEIQAREILRMRERLAKIISRETGQPVERVRADIDRDHWMTVEEAMEYGIVSRAISTMADLGADLAAAPSSSQK